jgi:DNA-binding transcriptional MerR regulator
MKNQGFMSIGEASALLDVPVHTIRYWEKEFDLVLKPPRTAGSHRFFGPKELSVLKCIKKMLWEEKYSIAGTRQKFERKARALTRIGNSSQTPPETEPLVFDSAMEAS